MGKLSPFGKQYWLNKGLTEAEAIFKLKSLKKFHKEYWMVRGFSEEDSIKELANFQSSMSKKHYAKVDTSSYEYKCTNNTFVEYYISRGANLEEAIELLKIRQGTFSLEKCIKKYGNVKGEKIFKERQFKWQNTLSNLENINDINKSKDSVSWEHCLKKAKGNYNNALEIREKRMLDIMQPFKFSSKESIRLLEKLYDKLILLGILDSDIYWDYNNRKEFYINIGYNFYSYDFTIRSKKIIIEYNGSAFHPNPILTDDLKCKWYRLFSTISYNEALIEDDLKIRTAIAKGFKVFVIWDTDDDKKINNIFEEIIKICKNE